MFAAAIILMAIVCNLFQHPFGTFNETLTLLLRISVSSLQFTRHCTSNSSKKFARAPCHQWIPLRYYSFADQTSYFKQATVLMLSDSFILLFFHQNAGFVLGSPSPKKLVEFSLNHAILLLNRLPRHKKGKGVVVPLELWLVLPLPQFSMS